LKNVLFFSFWYLVQETDIKKIAKKKKKNWEKKWKKPNVQNDHLRDLLWSNFLFHMGLY